MRFNPRLFTERRMAMKKTLLILTFSAIALISLSLIFVTNRANAEVNRKVQSLPVPRKSQSRSIQELTERMLLIYQDAQNAEPQDRQSLMDELRVLASTRTQLLLGQIHNDPSQVVQSALPDQVFHLLPVELQAYFERATDLTGELEAVIQESETQSEVFYTLNTADKRIALHPIGKELEGLLTGTRVRVRGVQIENELVLYSGGNSTSTSSVQITSPAPLPSTFGEQKVLVMLVNFQDKATQPYTVEQARNVTFTTTSNFDLENSYGQTWLTGDVAGWFTIPSSYTTCNTTEIASYAKQAAQAAGYNLSNYNRYVYGFPSNACSFWGQAYLGGNPSQAWINGSFQLAVVGHELGHGFGLYHSHSLDCGSQIVGGTCTSSEYGDIFDLMGDSYTNHFNAYQKERLGWLGYGSSPAITPIQTSGTYWIDSYSTPGSGTKALKVLKSVDPSTGKKTFYYLEARRAIGFDSSFSSNSNMTNGVLVHTGSESSGNQNYLLDMTPQTSSWSDPALVAGQSFNDSTAGITITTVFADSTGAMVDVSFGPVACVGAKPALSASPSKSDWVKPGTSVSYTISVTNYDNGGCVPSTFNLQASVPSGWSSTFGNSTITIAPGATASTTLTVTSPSTASEGSYSIGLSVANMGNLSYSASTSLTYTAVSSLVINEVTDRTSYTRTQTASTKAIVKAMGMPVSGAAVNFTLRKPDGTVVSGTLLTGTDGSAVFKYKFKRNDPVGTYQVDAASSLNGLSGSAATAFTVQ